jgi:hypothetical protein
VREVKLLILGVNAISSYCRVVAKYFVSDAVLLISQCWMSSVLCRNISTVLIGQLQIPAFIKAAAINSGTQFKRDRLFDFGLQISSLRKGAVSSVLVVSLTFTSHKPDKVPGYSHCRLPRRRALNWAALGNFLLIKI